MIFPRVSIGVIVGISTKVLPRFSSGVEEFVDDFLQNFLAPVCITLKLS